MVLLFVKVIKVFIGIAGITTLAVYRKELKE